MKSASSLDSILNLVALANQLQAALDEHLRNSGQISPGALPRPSEQMRAGLPQGVAQVGTAALLN